MRICVLVLLLFSAQAQSATTRCLALLKERISYFFEHKSKASFNRVLKALANKKVKGIESERLTLKALKEEDVGVAHQILNDAESTLSSNPSTYEESKRSRVEAMLVSKVVEKHFQSRVAFAVYEKNTQRLVGSVSLSYFESDNIYRISYVIEKDSQSKGYATEAIASLLDFYKTTSDQKIPIYATSLSSNWASRKVLEKLGFQHNYDRPAEVVEGISYPPQSVYLFP